MKKLLGLLVVGFIALNGANSDENGNRKRNVEMLSPYADKKLNSAVLSCLDTSQKKLSTYRSMYEQEREDSKEFGKLMFGIGVFTSAAGLIGRLWCQQLTDDTTQKSLECPDNAWFGVSALAAFGCGLAIAVHRHAVKKIKEIDVQKV